jgi:hypothetical protein
MSFKALGFYSIDAMNIYFGQNPDQSLVGLAQGFVANSMVVVMEGAFLGAGEIGLLSQPMAATDDTIVALENAKPVAAGDLIRIDNEVMTVVDASDRNNLVVTRGSPAGAHAVGAVVYIG